MRRREYWAAKTKKNPAILPCGNFTRLVGLSKFRELVHLLALAGCRATEENRLPLPIPETQADYKNQLWLSTMSRESALSPTRGFVQFLRAISLHVVQTLEFLNFGDIVWRARRPPRLRPRSMLCSAAGARRHELGTFQHEPSPPGSFDVR